MNSPKVLRGIIVIRANRVKRMVKELGMFFEEFTKEYLHIVEKCESVETNHPLKITSEDYKAVEGIERQAYRSDIDVLGVRGDVVHIISCSEIIGTKKVVNRIEKNLIYAERAVRRDFLTKRIVKRVACISKRKDLVFKDVKDILYFKDMFTFLLRNIRRRGKTDQYVPNPSEWLIRALDLVGVFLGREKAYEIYKFPAKTHVVSLSEGFRRPS